MSGQVHVVGILIRIIWAGADLRSFDIGAKTELRL
jgi:hypothetical protein